MSTAKDDIEAHREAVLRRWLDSPRHSWIGMHARNRTELTGEIRVTMRRQSRDIRDLADTSRDPQRVGHPFAGANRKAKRAAKAKAKRRA